MQCMAGQCFIIGFMKGSSSPLIPDSIRAFMQNGRYARKPQTAVNICCARAIIIAKTASAIQPSGVRAQIHRIINPREVFAACNVSPFEGVSIAEPDDGSQNNRNG